MTFKRVPWDKILSYDADVTMIADSRGRGKTFGMREQFLRDYIKNHRCFVQIVRHESRIRQIANGYFDALYKLDVQGKATSRVARKQSYIFKRQGHDYLCQQVPKDVDIASWKPKKGEWDRIGYFVSLSKAQDYKEMTFANVRRLCLDEALIQNPNGHHNYLPLEFEQLISIVDTCTREQPDVQQHKPNVYLLSNACSIVNPYFQHYGITSIPPNDFSWWGNKTFLLYVGNDTEYADAKATQTVAGRMSAHTITAKMANENQFVTARTGLIAKKTAAARFSFGMICNGQKYGVWLDLHEGLYFVNGKVPEHSEPVYALATADNGLNYIVAKRSQPIIQNLVEMYSLGLVRFSTPVIREKCENEVFKLYGLR